MEKKNIKKYVASGLLAVALLSGAGLEIHDTCVDHTKEVCLITRIMNTIPNVSYFDQSIDIPTGVALHQWPEMENDYTEKGIKDIQISYGRITERVEETQTVMPREIKNKDGKTIFIAPDGYCLTRDENGNLVCQKTIAYTQDIGYGLKACWGEPSYDANERNEEVLITR